MATAVMTAPVACQREAPMVRDAPVPCGDDLVGGHRMTTTTSSCPRRDEGRFWTLDSGRGE